MKSALPRARAKAKSASSAPPAASACPQAAADAVEAGRPSEPRATRSAPWSYAVASAVSALWTLALIVATAPLHWSGLALLLTALLAIGPTALMLSLAYLVRQGDHLADASIGPDDQGALMIGPALRAAAGAGHVADKVQSGLVEAAAAADRARDDLESLRRELSGDRGPASVVTDLVGANRASLARRMKNEGRDLVARSEALDAQLARAAEVIDLDVQRAAAAAGAAAARFGAADKSLEASTARLRPAGERAASVVREAGRLADREAQQLEVLGEDAAAKIAAVGASDPAAGGALSPSIERLRQAQREFLEAARTQAEALQAIFVRTAAAAKEVGARAVAAGQALRSAMEAAPRDRSVPVVAAAEQAQPEGAAAAEVRPSAAAEASGRRPAAVVARPVDHEAEPTAPIVMARGIGGQVLFDGARVLIDRSQSTSFVMHGAGGQRSIQLTEVVKIRCTPPRRGAHGYLQFVLSRGHEGRGGPADVNSILFDASQQASFQQMAEVLKRALRHLRRRPDASDPRAPGELVHLMDLRGRGLIDAREFADATSRLKTAKRGSRSWFRMNLRR